MKVEYGTSVNATCHVLDAKRVNLEMTAEVSDLVPGPDFNQPTVLRTSADTNVTAWDNRYLVWAAVTPTDVPAGQDVKRGSVYIMVRPRINLPPEELKQAADERRARWKAAAAGAAGSPHGHGRARDAFRSGHRWRQPSTKAGVSPDPCPPNGPDHPRLRADWSAPPDLPSPDSLLAALDLLQKNGQATISSQQILTQEHHQSQIKALKEEWSTRTEPHKIETGTVVTVRPHVAPTTRSCLS